MILAFLAGVGVLLAQASSDPTAGVLDYVLQYGVLGIMFVLFATRKIRTDGEVKDLQKLLAQKDEIITRYQERYEDAIPLLAEAVRLLPKISEQIRGGANDA